ncbi:MAG: presenilin family intramembrane aspartyl protease [Nanoarchaeota archaeon]
MKHNFKIIFVLTLLFLLAQYIGLFISYNYFDNPLPYNIQKPEFEEETSFVGIFTSILIVTFLAIMLVKIKAEKLWRIWFFLSVWFALLISFSVFIKQEIAIILALVITYFKVLKPNVIIHNAAELFIYGGLAAIFSSSLSIFSVSILLILISIYDMIAVWKTKHMIKLAKFQTKLKLFAGLLVPYKHKKEIKTAILGGGDIGFPLLFSSAVLKDPAFGLEALVIPITTSILLVSLFMLGKKNHFYPAMPFLSIGCFLGYLIILLL